MSLFDGATGPFIVQFKNEGDHGTLNTPVSVYVHICQGDQHTVCVEVQVDH